MTSASATRRQRAARRVQVAALLELMLEEADPRIAAAEEAYQRALDNEDATPTEAALEELLDLVLSLITDGMHDVENQVAAESLPPGHPLRLLTERRTGAHARGSDGSGPLPAERWAPLWGRVWDGELLALLAAALDGLQADDDAGHIEARRVVAVDDDLGPPPQRLALTTSTLTAAPPALAG